MPQFAKYSSLSDSAGNKATTSNSSSNYFSAFVGEFNKNTIVAIADYDLGNVGSSSIGVASSFSLVVNLVEDYSNYREEPVKMMVAMTVTVSGTAVSVAGSGAIAAIPGVGPWVVVIGGVVWDTVVGMAQDYIKEQL